MQASFYIIVRNGFVHELRHLWFKRMVIACAHDACDCPGYPVQSAQSDGHVGGQHDVSENAVFISKIFCLTYSCCLL